MGNTKHFEISPAAALAVTGQSAPIEVTSKEICIALDATAVAGATPTLDVTIEWSGDAVNWFQAATPDAFTQLTAAGGQVKELTAKARYYRVVWTFGGTIAEVQAITHDYTGGTFTASFDGEGPTAPLPHDAQLVSVVAQGTLTMDVKPLAAIAAQGTLTMDTIPADTNTVTIDTTVYTFQTVLTNVANNVLIGVDLAASKRNLVAAINRAAGYGTQYAALTAIHPTVSIADFIVNDAILTAKTAGVAGDSIATTETFTPVTNVFDATTLGAVTPGTAGDTLTIGADTYTFQDVLTNVANNVHIGATLATAQANLVAAIDLSGTAGTDYALATVANPEATMAAFAADAAILTAVSNVAATGNAVVTTETFTAVTNIFNATTLGTTTLGTNGIETELEKFTNIGDVSMIRNGVGDWDITFVSGTGDRPLISLDITLLTGGTISGVVESAAGVAVVWTFGIFGTHFDN
jgi:hypothetical protein